jgi:hypothetical protein
MTETISDLFLLTRISDIVSVACSLEKCFLAYQHVLAPILVLLFVAPPSSLPSSFLPCVHFPEFHASILAQSESLLESDTITYGMMLYVV